MRVLKSTLLASVASCAVAAVSLPADAQSVLMEEIVVTAQKREQSLQDVGISVTAFSGDQLRALGYTNAQQVTAMAPGVSTLQPNGEANYAIGIRGVANNDFTTNVESPIALYVDEVYISQMSGAGFQLFDLERVEILRGPQGTLFGRNATGGLVHYITRKPSLEAFDGYGSVSYTRFERVHAQGAVNIPLADTLAVRASFSTQQGGGYVENRLRPERDLNNQNDIAGRVQLLYTSNDDLEVLFNVRYSSQDIRTGFFEYVSAVLPNSTPTPGVPNSNLNGYIDLDDDVYAGDYDFPGFNDLETYGISGTVNWDLGFAELTSITDFSSVERNYIEDSDASPVNYFNFFLTTDADQFSQELRLSGEEEDFTWVVGFYYLNIDISDSNGAILPGFAEDAFGAPVEVLGFNGLNSPYTIDTESYSFFGQVSYDVTERLTFTAGFRWIEEEKDFSYTNDLALFPENAASGLSPNIVSIAPNASFSSDRSDGEWSARVAAEYRALDDLLLYASWNRGVKSGSFNAPLLINDPAFASPEFLEYEPERLDAYEIGFKWDLFNGRARVNGAAYYYDYKDYQAFSIVGLDTFTLNAEAENKGFELEAQANLARGFDVQLGIGYVDAEVTDVPGLTIDAETSAGTIPAAVPGETLTPVQTPEWNVNGLVRYGIPIGPGELAVQASAEYRGEHFFALLQTPAVSNDSYTVANVAVTWTDPDRNYAVRFFVDNVTDEEYVVQAFDLSGNVDNGGGFVGMIEQYYGRPRIWGVQLDYQF